MCIAVYIASDYALPTIGWDEAKPAFHVMPLEFPVGNLRQYFSKPILYSVGSHHGCGCGFAAYEYFDDQGDWVKEDDPQARAARHGLALFLTAALRLQDTVEVIICCSGNEVFPPQRRGQALPDDFLDDSTLFDLSQLIVVSAQRT